jgi:Plant transposon protein
MTPGSRPGQSINKDRDFANGHRWVMLDYFRRSDELRDDGSNLMGPVYDENDFERTFRMPRGVFSNLFSGIVSHNAYLRRGLSSDVTGRLGAASLQKVVAALRQISLGICADSVDEYCRVIETTALVCLKEFSKSVVCVFGPLHLREPTSEDISRVEQQFNAVGFPGCIGCLDCAGWIWKNCPKTLQGSHIGK